ncbi:MAG: PRC-barrel domain-containing protein, partial [Candidatus Bathyarchaeia archaeon]
MEKTNKPLTRDALVTMQVIDSKGRSVGKVKDVCFAVGKNGISLAIEDDNGETQTVEWEDVQAASDFIILKPQQSQTAVQEQTQSTQKSAQPVSKQKSQPLCPTCQKPL